MKKCVFITGTNGVGKSSIVWEFITRFGGVDRITNDVTYCKEGNICFAGRYGETRFGGVDRITNDVTYCKEGNICFAGRYGETRFGGVDRITNEKGSSCTSRLAEVVEEALRDKDIVICEGSFLDTFGMNLMNALFKAERQYVISLYADNLTIYKRLTNRSNGKNGKRSVQSIKKVFDKQLRCMRAARKWQEIGVKVLQINTAETSIIDIVDCILDYINKK